MFTGIVESMGRVHAMAQQQANVCFTVEAAFAHELAIDQSVAHNGVCLTVVAVQPPYYDVVAVHETLQRTNLQALRVGDALNLERCLRADARLDGHFVQGHVDCTGIVKSIGEDGGSWRFYFTYPQEHAALVVPKGSICINGISLTVVDADPHNLSVAVIPYTYAHTNLQFLKAGDSVNLEFDVLGKYVQRILNLR
jgi:riboflavin synthase